MTIFRLMELSGEKDLCVCENHLADAIEAALRERQAISPVIAIDENSDTVCEWEPHGPPCETEPSERLRQYVDDRLKGHMDLLRRELMEGRYVTMKELTPVAQMGEANNRQLENIQAALLREYQWRVNITNRMHALEAALKVRDP